MLTLTHATTAGAIDVELSDRHSRFARTAIRTAPADAVKSTGLRAIKPGKSNGKLGKGRIARGPAPYRGRVIYALTLEERATCPSTCNQLDRCYGDNMPFAIRFIVDDALYAAIRADLATLDSKHPEGYVIRLHVLGDFKHPAYVAFWAEMMAEHPGLAVYGYTHWPADSRMGQLIAALCARYPDRFRILRSDGLGVDDSLPRAVVVRDWADTPAGVTPCPEMTGKSESCATCGLCMNGRTSVSFIDHGQGARRDHSPSLLAGR